MPTISKDNDYVTLINVFNVDPSGQQQLVDLLGGSTSSAAEVYVYRHTQIPKTTREA
jgi:hypothetical protein